MDGCKNNYIGLCGYAANSQSVGESVSKPLSWTYKIWLDDMLSNFFQDLILTLLLKYAFKIKSESICDILCKENTSGL